MKRISRVRLALVTMISMTACDNSSMGQPIVSSKVPKTNVVVTDKATEPLDEELNKATDSYDWPGSVTMLGASSGGNTQLNVSAIAQIISEHTDSTYTAQVTADSAQNPYLVEVGNGDYGSNVGHYLYCAKNGMGNYKDTPVDLGAKLVMICSSSIAQIVCHKGSKISGLNDLVGRKVVVDTAGSGSEDMCYDLMGICGLYTETDGYKFKTEYSSPADGVELIQNGQADTMIMTGAIPMTNYPQLFATKGIYLIGFTEEQVRAIVNAEIGYSKAVMPTGSYEGEIKEGPSSAISVAGSACKASCSEEEVYWVTRLIVEHWEELEGMHNLLAGTAARDVLELTYSDPYVEIHPGAVRCSKEIGWVTEQSIAKGDIMADVGNKTLGQDTAPLSSVETVDIDTQQELLDKCDRDSAAEKESKNWGYKVSDITGGMLCLRVCITCVVDVLEALMRRTISMCFCLTMISLLYALRKQDIGRLPRRCDFIIIATVLAACGYVISNHRPITTGSGIAPKLEIFLCILLVLTVVGTIRRSGGTNIVIIIITLLAYTHFGKYVPGVLKHSGLSIERIASQLLLASEGLFGSSVGTAVGVFSLFLIFATFMEKTGTGQFINDLALSIAGKPAGGSAKVSTVTSVLFSTISGNAVSNVVATGAFTIPLVKETGYEPKSTGAVEAVSSTAGQFMPLIMGASAFIMADITEIAYSKICLAAIVPVLLYYTGCFTIVYPRTCELGLKGLAREDYPKLLLVLKEDGYLSLPPIFVAVILYVGYIITWVGVRAIPPHVPIAACEKKTRLGSKNIWQCLQLSGKRSVSVAAMYCSINMIMAVRNLAGIIQILGNVVLKLAGGNFTIPCISIVVTCIVMGMGLFTISVYMLLSTVAIPALISGFNVPVLAARVLVLYFGLLANVTPPVAIPAYTAAGLANADPGKTGWQTFKLALGGFPVPMIFINSSDLLFHDGLVTIQVIEKIATAMMGVIPFSAAVEGWMFTKMQRWQGAAVAVAATLIVIPTTLTDVIGATVMMVTGLSQNRLLIQQKQG